MFLLELYLTSGGDRRYAQGLRCVNQTSTDSPLVARYRVRNLGIIILNMGAIFKIFSCNRLVKSHDASTNKQKYSHPMMCHSINTQAHDEQCVRR